MSGGDLWVDVSCTTDDKLTIMKLHITKVSYLCLWEQLNHDRGANASADEEHALQQTKSVNLKIMYFCQTFRSENGLTFLFCVNMVQGFVLEYNWIILNSLTVEEYSWNN